ncbi:hypothetical protein ZWY2020_009872 [Hordeum vulgare]|nr:hypothetical protein ZWY2020_009872 [Hordeum vulgare]
MASVIPDEGGDDMGGGDSGSDGGGGGTSLEGGGSFCEVDNWLGSSSYATQAGLQQPEAPLVQSSPTPGCSMGCRSSTSAVVAYCYLHQVVDARMQPPHAADVAAIDMDLRPRVSS